METAEALMGMIFNTALIVMIVATMFGAGLSTTLSALGGVVTLRMAGVFMTISGTIWMKTEVMPRWMVWLTYIMGLGLLIGAGANRWLRLGFLIWVLVVSLFILWGSLQRKEDGENIGA